MSYLSHPAIRALLDEEAGEPTSGNWNPDREVIAAKITHVLSVYPKISPSMMQVGIGPGIPSELWKPVWQALKLKGIVKEEQVQKETPIGRIQTYTLLSLVDINQIQAAFEQRTTTA